MYESPKLGELLRLWGIQESVLQSYRGIFLSAQSFLVSIASLLIALSNSYPLLVWWAKYPIIGIGFYLAWLWKTLTDERGKSVYFCQSLIRKYECGGDVPPPLTALKRFLHNLDGNKLDYIKNNEDYLFEIGRARVGKECASMCRSRWSPYH